MSNPTGHPFAIAYLEQRLLRQITSEDMSPAAVQDHLSTLSDLVARLNANDERLHLLLDARAKSFESLEAQRELSVGVRQRLGAASIAHAAQVTTRWQGAGGTDALPSFETLDEAWSHVTGQPLHWPRISLVVGSTGAGKTTFAHYLERDTSAIRFSTDAWMTTLFAPSKPADAGFDWPSACPSSSTEG
jgi:hypothetical protein